ncbi:MAG TPA: hypothetical protein VGN34_26120 [Ktedonobacteraceae bacterium]
MRLMISSPSPTQQSPGESEHGPVKNTPLRKRPGETPTARFIKAAFRPILKLIYHTLSGVQRHKLFSLVLILLLLASISVTSFFSTGSWPLGVGNDQFNFHIHGGSGGGEVVKNWLYALRSGDSSTLQLLDSDMSQPIDTTTLGQYISTFSQTSTRTWKSITVLKAYSQPDGTVDSFVEVEFSANGPGGPTNAMVIFHFVTMTQGRDYLLGVDPVSSRRMQ